MSRYFGEIQTGSGGNRRKYPWPDMEPGDWFDVPVPKASTPAKVINKVNKRRPDGIRTRTRTVLDDGRLIVRAWRLE